MSTFEVTAIPSSSDPKKTELKPMDPGSISLAIFGQMYDDDEPDLDLVCFGANLRQLRNIRGYSTRQLAKAAGIAKATLLRAEQGLPTRKIVRNKLCAALSVRLGDLTAPLDEAEHVVHRSSSQFWQIVRGPRPTPFHFGSDRLGDPEERARLARLGWASRFINNFRSNPAKSEFVACEVEIYTPDVETVSHPGEELIYVIEGSIRIEIAGEEIVLGRGDSLTFDCGKPHRYAVDPGFPAPARALIIVRQGSVRRRPQRSRSKAVPVEKA